MKTRIAALAFFVFSLFSSHQVFAESFVTSHPDPHVVVFQFAGKSASDTMAVPVFRHSLTMEIPSGITGNGPLRFSYSLSDSDTGPMTVREAFENVNNKKLKEARFLVVSLSNEKPVFIFLKPGVAKTFYVVSSDGEHPARATLTKVTAKLLDMKYSEKSESMSIDWTKILK